MYSITPLFRCSRRTSVLTGPLFRCSRRTNVLNDPPVQVQQEDNMICDSVQVGLESSAYDMGRCVPWMNDYYRIA